MSAPQATIATTFPTLIWRVRLVAGVVLGAVLCAITWLFVLQEGHTGNIFGATWTNHDFPDGLGHALGAEDTAKAGLYATLAMGVVAAALFAAIQGRLPGRGIVKGLSFAPILFLTWGLAFAPLVDAREFLDRDTTEFVYLPNGLFGIDAGVGTIASAAAASILAAIILARVVDLARDGNWWQEHPDVGHGMIDEETAAALLELPEERPEQRVEGTR